MTKEGATEVDEMPPRAAFEQLRADPDSVLVDVRTGAEWAYVGRPDLSELGRRLITVEWVTFPSMQPNRAFLPQLVEACGGDLPERLIFICRSGARSLAAARFVADALGSAGRPIQCTNVAEGFEGDLDRDGHRGRVNGWKVAGLPWRQS